MAYRESLFKLTPIMTPEQKIRAEAAVTTFITDFYSRFGTAPKVIVNYEKNVPILSLGELETIINMQLEEDYPEIFKKITEGKGIRFKTRKNRVVIFRNIFFTLSNEYGHPLTTTGDHLGYNHCSVHYGKSAVKNSDDLWQKTLIEKIETRIQTYLNN